MCPNCPRCNASQWGCQDLFGSNMRPLGGILGGALAFEGGNEYQGHGTPHFHGQVHVVCMYQFATLKEIADKIEAGLQLVGTDIQGAESSQRILEDMKAYQNWYHVERPLHQETHDAYESRAAEEFYARHQASEHTPLSVTPAFLQADADAKGQGSLCAESYDEKTPATDPSSMPSLEAEGKQFVEEYFLDTQFVFSRVQHHVHKKCKDGSYEPLNACAKKQRGKKVKKSEICKHDFPRKAMPQETALICQGLANKYNLRVSGRRNAYGLWLGRRTGAWQSGTTPAFASQFRSNTHTMPNYRVPPTLASHDPSCPSKSCAKQCSDSRTNPRIVKVVAKLAQRVQREATGYYCGYTFKGQPVGRKYLAAAASTLDYLTTGLADKSPGQQWHRITQRLLIDMQHRCMTRPAPEEWNLAAVPS